MTMRIVRFKSSGSLSRQPFLDYTSERFWIQAESIALQISSSTMRDATPDIFGNVYSQKEIIPLITDDGSIAFAVCAPGGWEPWIEEL